MGATSVESSDKFFWHRYTEFYEPYFRSLADAKEIVEFGVFHGDSIRYLSSRFPDANIVGADILPPQPEWPTGPRIEYVTLDQADPGQIARMFDALPAGLDLVIEDGSHDPRHQHHCLVASIPRLRDGGVYVLEDLHTSHPAHPLARQQSVAGRANCYNLVLAFEHLKATGAELSDGIVANLTADSLFTADEVRSLFARIGHVALYRRATLPLWCYSCGTADFDFAALRCRCGVELNEEADSMSAVLVVQR